jgi:hypothetical protein
LTGGCSVAPTRALGAENEVEASPTPGSSPDLCKNLMILVRWPGLLRARRNRSHGSLCGD